MMSQSYEEQLNKHFQPLVQKHGASHKSVNWGSESSQNLRFKMLLSFDPKEGQSLLDLGCGVGHLFKFIEANYPGINYKGIDLVPDMISQAKQSYPQTDFEKADILEKNWENSFDLVVASGIFYIGCDYDGMFACLESMWKSARKVISFNSLSSWASEKDEGEFYADPLKVVDYCRSLSSKVILRHDYMPHDFTVQVFRD